MKPIPLWYDHGSEKIAINLLERKELTEGGQKSIVKLCKDHGIKECYGISNNFNTFIEAWKNLKEEKIDFRFGLEMILCDDSSIHTPDSLKNNHKIIIFARNSDAYKDLGKIFTACYVEKNNFYYQYRFDYKKLNPLWTNNLILALPFSDSFVSKNNLSFGAQIIPDLPAEPVILRENTYRTSHGSIYQPCPIIIQ